MLNDPRAGSLRCSTGDGNKEDTGMAVTYTVNTRIAGNPQKALAWAADITTYVKENYNDTLRCLVRVGGPQGAVAFASTVADLGALETQLAKIQDDTEYQKRVNQALEEGLLDGASTETAIWSDLV
jgi:hypothetical protein